MTHSKDSKYLQIITLVLILGKSDVGKQDTNRHMKILSWLGRNIEEKSLNIRHRQVSCDHWGT